MKKAYGYCRLSGQGQLDGNGFDRQEQTIQDFAKSADIKIVEIYQEQVSGVKDEEDRPVFQQMISDILRNGVRTIIVERLDRLAREYRIQESLIIYLASKDITLINAGTGEDVTKAINSDPMKKALIQMQGIFAELEKNLLVKKLRTARETIREDLGKCEGRKGYNENPEKRDFLLKTIKKLRRKPKGKKRMTYAATAARLNEMKIESLTGKEWSGAMVQNFLQRFGK